MDETLRRVCEQIGSAALQAADPAQGVRQALWVEPGVDGPTLHVGPAAWPLTGVERVLLAAVGKAAIPMAAAAAEILGRRLTAGVVVTKIGHTAGHSLPSSLQVYEAGHPTPDLNGLLAAGHMLRLLESAGADDRVIGLLSGGASALLPLPVSGVSLEDLQALTGLLLRSGATINELNTVRKHLDRLKGGGMARAAAPAPLAALILSDVVGDPLEVIASGPTVPDPTTYRDAWEVLERFRLVEQTPAAIRAHLQAGLGGAQPETPKPGDPLFTYTQHHLIGSNRQAALAAKAEAERLGYPALVLTTHLEGEAREMGKLAAALARSILQHGDPLPPPACLILGGETTVTVRGNGRGGRNQELALAAALALDGLSGATVMALATDGSDGPTDAAGAIVDGQTLSTARRLRPDTRSLGLDAHAALSNNDAYPFLEKTGALLRTGPTGTNVNDLLIILCG